MAEEFKLHKINLVADDKEYLANDNHSLENGFQANTPAYSAAVNAVLHETSLIVCALADDINYRQYDGNTISPITSRTNAKDIVYNYFYNRIKTTQVDVASTISNAIKFAINTTTETSYNGSQSGLVIGPVFGPKTSPSAADRIPVSTADASEPVVWSTSAYGTTDTPIYLNNGILTNCTKYAAGTNVELNNTSRSGQSISIFAPESIATSFGQTSGYAVCVCNASNDANPIWIPDDNLHAGSAASVDNYLTISLNGDTSQTSKYNGSTARTYEFYAPTGAGTDSQMIVSNGSTPTWYDSAIYIKSKLQTLYNSSNTNYAYVMRNQQFAIRANQSNTIINDTSDTSLQNNVILNDIHYVNVNTSTHEMQVINYVYDQIFDSARTESSRYHGISYVWSTDLLRYFLNAYSYHHKDLMKLTLTGRGRTTTGSAKLWVDSGGITTAGMIEGQTFNSTSDERLKENIKDYTPAKSILDLQIKEFDFKIDGSHHIGCIAQDLQKIAPELVHEDDNGYLNIEETKLVYLLLDEVKKLRKELDELKKGSK